MVFSGIRTLGDVARDGDDDGRSQFVRRLLTYVSGHDAKWSRADWARAQDRWSEIVGGFIEDHRSHGRMDVAEQLAIEYLYIEIFTSAVVDTLTSKADPTGLVGH